MTIPGINIDGHITINDLILLGSTDPRYTKLKNAVPNLAKYIDSFKTPFGQKLNPSIVVRDENLPKVDSIHLSAFRNAIAVSGVIYSRIQSCLSNSSRGFTCSDLFDFYPISLSSGSNDLSVKTFSTIGIDSLDRFQQGQATAVEPYPHTIQQLFDDELMLALLNIIETKPKETLHKKRKTKITRSLEMGYYALRSPFAHLGSETDYGVGISCWVAAFEILANPHNKKVTFREVSNLIKNVVWQSAKLRQKRYTPVYKHTKKPKQKTTLPVQIYGRLYQTRNMYIHGDPIPSGQFEFRRRKNWGNLFFQVPALYRSVLLHFALNGSAPSHTQHRFYQRDYERVLTNKL